MLLVMHAAGAFEASPKWSIDIQSIFHQGHYSLSHPCLLFNPFYNIYQDWIKKWAGELFLLYTHAFMEIAASEGDFQWAIGF